MIKEELFFIRKLLKDRYGLGGVLNYFKNKFFSGPEIKKINPFCNNINENFELHTLCQNKDVPMLFWSLSSFLYHSGLCPKIFVHDDGSMDIKSVEFLERKFTGLKVILKSEADNFIKSKNLNSRIMDYRENGHKLIYKLIDIFFMCGGDKVMILDSDVLFFNRPKEIIDFIKGKPSAQALITRHDGPYDLMMTDEYSVKHDLSAKETAFMNSGLILFDHSIISEKKMTEYIEATKRSYDDYFVEMTGWGCVISQSEFNFLSPKRYHIKGRPNSDTVAKHFTGPRRHELYAYGIDMLRESLRLKA